MRHFLSQAEGDVLRGQVMDPQAQEMLYSYSWPGNVRELRYFIHRLCATVPDTLDAATMQAELLMPFDCQRSPLSAPGHETDAGPCAGANPCAAGTDSKGPAHVPAAGESERERIVQALQACYGHQGNAALMLRMSRSTLFRKMRKFGIR